MKLVHCLNLSDAKSLSSSLNLSIAHDGQSPVACWVRYFQSPEKYFISRSYVALQFVDAEPLLTSLKRHSPYVVPGLKHALPLQVLAPPAKPLRKSPSLNA